MSDYLELLRRRPAFRRLWLAQLISQTGDWLGLVAVSVVAGETGGQTGGALALAAVLAAHLLPNALLSPWAGVAADRYDRRTLLIAGNVAEGLLTLAMVAAAWMGQVWVLSALLLVRSALGSAREPASGAALPRLVDASEVATANALGATTWSATFVVGMALGGVAAELGPELALAVDASTFALAVFSLWALPSMVPQRGAAPSAVGAEIREALGHLRALDVRAAVLGKAPAAFSSGMAWIGLNLYAQRYPGAGGVALTLGLLQAARGLGTGLGPVAALWGARRGVRASWVAGLALVAELAGAGLVFTASLPSEAFAGVLLWGAGAGALWVITATEIVERSSDGVRGRLMAIDAIGFALSMSAGGALTAGALTANVPEAWVALGVVGAAALAWVWVRRAPLAIAPQGQGAPAP